MTLTGKARAALRAQAHHLDPILQIGQQGITPALVHALDDALRARELIKLQVGRGAGLAAREVAPLHAAKLAAEVIQVIGRTVTLFRPKPDDEAASGIRHV